MNLEHVRLHDHKALKLCTLHNLGRINVICGKNNSGKSTVVEALVNQQKRLPGKALSDEDAETICQRTWRTHGFGPNEASLARYRQMVLQTARLRPLWFLDEDSGFKDQLYQHFQAVFGRYAYGGDSVSQAFRSVLSNDIHAVLVPPKRSLEVSGPLEAGRSGEPSGKGVINELFFLANQLTGSAARRRFAAVREAFREVTGGWEFQIVTLPTGGVEVFFARETDKWLQASNCGLGLQDCLEVLFFSLHPEYHLVAIEEPEAHMHAQMQRQLVRYLRDVPDKQFFITTHSSVFLDSRFVDRVFLANCTDEVSVSDETSRSFTLRDLGYSVAENLVSDAVVLVEGPRDVPVIEEFLEKLGCARGKVVHIWPLGGDIMNQLDLSLFLENWHLFAIVDRDPGSARTRNAFVRGCKKLGIKAWRLKRYSIENYFPLRALREVFGDQLPKGLDSIDPDKSVESQTGFSVKGNNHRIARATTAQEIEGTDLAEYLHEIGNSLKTD